MTDGIRSPNLPLGTSLGEFIGHEIVGGKKSVKRFTRANVIGSIEALTSSYQTGGGVIFSTRAQANTSLNYDAMRMAWVVLDPSPANNGIYQKSGASGSGSWTRFADLPYSFYRLENIGAGTANAIAADNQYPIPSESALVVVNITSDNTASPVTLTINGGTPLTVKTSSGNDIAIGGFVTGMLVAGYIDGSNFRLITDEVSSAIVTAAETARGGAEDAADLAVAAAATVSIPIIFAADAGKIISVNSSGNWQLMKRTALLPDDFGWTAGGSLAARHAAMVAWAADSRPGELDRNTDYQIDLATGSLLVAAGKIIEGNGALIYDTTTHGKLLTLVPGFLNSATGMLAGRWQIGDLRLQGALVATYSGSAYGIFVEGTDNSGTSDAPTYVESFLLDNVEINDIAGYGIWEHFTDGGLRQNVKMQDIGYIGFAAMSCRGLRVIDSRVVDLGPGTSSNAYGFTFTRDATKTLTTGPRSSDCVLDRWLVKNNTIYSGVDTHSGEGIKILNGRAENVYRGINVGYDADGVNAHGNFDCVVKNNTLIAATTSQCGILHTGYASAADGYSVACVIDGNYIEGFGLASSPTLGGIIVQGTLAARVTNNHTVRCKSVGFCYAGDNLNCVASGNNARDAYSDTVASGVGVFNGNNKITFGPHTFYRSGAVLGNSNMPYGYNVDASSGDSLNFMKGDIVLGTMTTYNGTSGKGQQATWASL